MSIRNTARAVIPVALTWGVVWGVYGSGWLLYHMFLLYRSIGNTGTYSVASILGGGLSSGILGTIAGLIFVSIFSRAERGGRVEELSRWRITAWGGLSGLIYLVLLVGLLAAFGRFSLDSFDLLWNTVWSLALGAGSGTLTLAIARRGQLPAPVEVRELGA